MLSEAYDMMYSNELNKRLLSYNNLCLKSFLKEDIIWKVNKARKDINYDRFKDILDLVTVFILAGMIINIPLVIILVIILLGIHFL